MCNLLRYKDRLQQAYAKFEFSEVRIEPTIRFKVAPSEPAPVITIDQAAARIGMMRFGLQAGKGRQLMARGETVERLPMFRDAFRRRRCLVIAHGFYDSVDMGGYRQPWHIHLKGDELMCFAGLWETDTDDGKNFTIVSAPANRVVARVIDRMPVILPEGAWKAWLDPATPINGLKEMLEPFPDDLMEAWPVTRELNKRGFESPRCVEPVVVAQGELNLE